MFKQFYAHLNKMIRTELGHYSGGKLLKLCSHNFKTRIQMVHFLTHRYLHS